jgi:hypothetical protein
MADDDDEFVGMYDLLEAVEAVIIAADPAKRDALAKTIDGYMQSCPDEFFWAVGATAPALLHHLMTAIDGACREQGKPRPPLRLADFKKPPA